MMVGLDWRVGAAVRVGGTTEGKGVSKSGRVGEMGRGVIVAATVAGADATACGVAVGVFVTGGAPQAERSKTYKSKT